MKKYLLLLLLIPTICFAQDMVFLANKTTGTVTDAFPNTTKNYQTLLNRTLTDKTDCEVKTGVTSKDVVYRKWDGSKVVVDIVTKTAKEYEASIKKKIQIKGDIAIIDELLKTSIGAEATELQKQKTELEKQL